MTLLPSKVTRAILRQAEIVFTLVDDVRQKLIQHETATAARQGCGAAGVVFSLLSYSNASLQVRSCWHFCLTAITCRSG